jgi:hypothetical protein
MIISRSGNEINEAYSHTHYVIHKNGKQQDNETISK